MNEKVMVADTLAGINGELTPLRGNDPADRESPAETDSEADEKPV